jgi:hypothetical protein
VRFLVGLLLALAIAAAVGLGASFLALTRDTAFGAFTVGAWTAWPRTGTADIDPYSRATVSRTGQLPMASGDGIAFFARADDQGRPLDGRCDVVIEGITPQARFWTLTLYDPAGRLVGNAAGRHGFTSQEVVRRADGSFAVTAAPRARAGNWLPTAGVERYVLVFRFYDSPVAAGTRAGREVPMPSVRRGDCP